MIKAAKRANRDEDVEVFAKFYKEEKFGVKFKDLKKQEDIPNLIKLMLCDK